jgi:hypothetical protein
MNFLSNIKLVVCFGLLGNLLIFSSCKKCGQADDTFFIQSNSISVVTKTSEGSGSNKITDLWLYTNGKFQGAYPIGNLMPIITKGQKTKINIFAGIKNNGISDTRLSYIFYQFLTLDTFVEKGKIVNIPIVFKYNPNTKFDWIENFDGSGISLVNSSISQSTLITAPLSESFENNSIKMELTGDAKLAQAESSVAYQLPTANSNVYLEFDYKGTQDFEVGLIGNTNELKQALIVGGKENWNHIYVQLSSAVSAGNVSSSYKVYFKMVKTVDNPILYLDNIKLLHL